MRPTAILLGLLTLAGCAQPAPPDHIFALFFGDDSAALDDSGKTIVARAAAVAKQFPKLPVSVAGYADRNGTPDNVVRMSTARADAVAAELVAAGVPTANIQRKAVGTPPDSQPGIERRRVEIDIGN